MAGHAPERKDHNPLLGPRCVLLQLAEFDARAVEGSQRKVRHLVADLDAALRRGFRGVMVAVLALLMLVLGVRALFVMGVRAVFFPWLSGRSLNLLAAFVTFARLDVASVGSCGRGSFLL